MSRYFVFIHGQSIGPVTGEELALQTGFGPTAQVWPEGWPGWVTASTVPELAALFNSIPADYSSNPWARVSDNSTGAEPVRDCPFCAEEICAEDRICPYCSSAVTDEAVLHFKQGLLERHEESEVRSVALHAPVGDYDPAGNSHASLEESIQPVVNESDFEGNDRVCVENGTVIFVDYSRSLAVFQEKNSTELDEISDAFKSDFDTTVMRHSGKILMGRGGRAIAFWAENTNSRSAYQAVVSSIAICSRIQSRLTRLEIESDVRVAVCTGTISFLEEDGATRVAGAAAALAEQMSISSVEKGVYVDEETWRQLKGRFKGQAGDIYMKGHGLIRTHLVNEDATGTHLKRRVVSTFHGREHEMGVLDDIIQSFLERDSNSSGVLVTGHGGTGKSKLCLQALTMVPDSVQILSSQGIPSEVHAFGHIVAGWLSGLVGGSDHQAVQSFFASHSELKPYRQDVEVILLGADDGGGGQEGKGRLEQRLGEVFAIASARRPVVLTAADMQWADSFSMDFCSHLALEIRRRGLALLMLFDGRPSRHTERIAAIEQIRHVHLGSLSRDETAAYLGKILVGDIPADWVEILHERTGGVILHLNQVLDALVDQSALEELEGTGKWRPAKNLEVLPVPRSLADLLCLQIERLSTAERNLLMTISVCGARFPRELVPMAAGLSDAEAGELLRELSTNGYLQISGQEVAFEHGSLRETARRMLMKVERRRIASRVVEALGTHIRRGRFRATAPILYREAERDSELMYFLCIEAHRCIRARRFVEVEDIFRMIEQRQWGEDDVSRGARVVYCTAKGRFAESRNDLNGAITFFEEAERLAGPTGEAVGRAIALGSLGRIAERRNDLKAAVAYYQTSLQIERESGNSRGQAVLLNCLGRLAEKNNEWATAEQCFETALSLGNWERDDPRGQSILLNSLGRLSEKKNDWPSALKYFERAYDMGVRSKGDPRATMIPLSSMARIHVKAKDLDRGLDCNLQALEIAHRASDLRNLTYIIMNLARIAQEVRAYTLARRLAERVVREYEISEDVRGKGFAQSFLERIPTPGVPESISRPDLIDRIERSLASIETGGSLAELTPASPPQVIAKDPAGGSITKADPMKYSVQLSSTKESTLVLGNGGRPESIRDALGEFRPTKLFADKFGQYEWGFFVQTTDYQSVSKKIKSLIHTG